MVDPKHVLGLLRVDKVEVHARATVGGRVLLFIRPDLEGQIDPGGVYRVMSNGSVTRVEQETEH